MHVAPWHAHIVSWQCGAGGGGNAYPRVHEQTRLGPWPCPSHPGGHASRIVHWDGGRGSAISHPGGRQTCHVPCMHACMHACALCQRCCACLGSPALRALTVAKGRVRAMRTCHESRAHVRWGALGCAVPCRAVPCRAVLCSAVQRRVLAGKASTRLRAWAGSGGGLEEKEVASWDVSLRA